MLDVRGHVWRMLPLDSNMTLMWRRRPFIINLTLKNQILPKVLVQIKKNLQKNHLQLRLIKWKSHALVRRRFSLGNDSKMSK